MGGEGFIPAHAGKTSSGSRRASGGRAHPHSRRENPAHDRHVRSPPGLIPAHAGKTTCSAPSASTCRAHPHSRGENRPIGRSLTASSGSSPLTRGKHRGVAGVSEYVGLIPAHAGKTSSHHSPASVCRAHPRSRGENARMTRDFAAQWGSSPLTRGKPEMGCLTRCAPGLIPTHTGITRSFPTGIALRGAHPRSRGENSCFGDFGCGTAGSSPLTRGKRLRTRSRGRAGRLIPAHAGKTVCRSTSRASRWAHPRSRGENGRSDLPTSFSSGSSPLTRGKQAASRGCCVAARLIPLTRGKRLDRSQRALRRRLIPAHAGKTASMPQ